jgi:hypothetical protein
MGKKSRERKRTKIASKQNYWYSSPLFDGLHSLASSHTELIWNYVSCRESVGLLRRGINQLQGRYLHTQVQP